MDRLGALAGRELRMLARSWPIALLYLTLPLIIAGFTREVFGAIDAVTGRPGNGASQAIPGQAVMFGVILLSQLGYSFFEEQAWGTWDRLRAAPIPLTSVVGTKLGANWLHQHAQCCLIVFGGGALLGLSFDGSMVAVVAVSASLAVAVTGFGFLAFSLSSSNAQYNAICYLGALVIAGCGGALVPFDLLPDWARAVGPLVPSYWGMRGLQGALEAGGSLGSVARHCGILLAMGTACLTLGAITFRPARRRRSYA